MPDLEHEEWLKDREAQAKEHAKLAEQRAKIVRARKAAADDEDVRRKLAKTREDEEKDDDKRMEQQYPD